MLRFTMLVLCLALSSACAPVTRAASPSGNSNTPEPGDSAPTASPSGNSNTPEPDDSAPTASPSGNPYAPQPGDSALTRDVFFLDKDGTSILTMESYPLQFMVSLKGSLPTGCHQPRIVVNPPDADNKIVLKAYSVVDPDKACAQMIQMFEGNIALGSFPQGHYSIWVNEEKIGEIDA